MTKPKVEFSEENISKCICPDCPVQGECMEAGKEQMGQKKEQQEKITPDDLKPVGMYCSSKVGISSCDDLDENKGCICASCPLWSENNLTQTYYCTKEEADREE